MRSVDIAAALGLAVLISGCGASAGTSAGGSPEAASPEATAPQAASSPTDAVVERAARADSVREHYTQADVDFMTDMIHHHAQALVMARMAPTHGASEPLETLAARIINSQKDEIARMQQWLRDRGEPVPEVTHAHGGAAHDAPMMAGMLTPEQMARLDAARGAEWDRLFLTYMIQHHKGALVMVDELFDSYGAAQGDEIFQLASDIGADQTSEIDRMQRMLQDLIFGSAPDS